MFVVAELVTLEVINLPSPPSHRALIAQALTIVAGTLYSTTLVIMLYVFYHGMQVAVREIEAKLEAVHSDHSCLLDPQERRSGQCR